MATYIIYRKSDLVITMVQSVGSHAEEGPERSAKDFGKDSEKFGSWCVPPEFFAKVRPDTLYTIAVSFSRVILGEDGEPKGIQVGSLEEITSIYTSHVHESATRAMVDITRQRRDIKDTLELYPQLKDRLAPDLARLEGAEKELLEHLGVKAVDLPPLFKAKASQRIVLDG